MSLKTGQLLWAVSNAVAYPDWGFDTNSPAGPNATCIADDGSVFSIGATGDLFCRDAGTGRIIWSTNLTAAFGLRDYAAITPSPLIEGNLLITVPGGSNATVVAFNKRTGRELWRALRDQWTYSSPIVTSAGGTRQVIVWTQNAVNGLQADTGQILWRQEIKSSGDTTVATPVAREDLVFAGGLMLKLGPGKTDHKVLWPDSASGPRRTVSNTSTPLIQGGAVYSHTTAGKLVCLDLETGRQLWETNSLTTPGNGSSLHFTVTPDCVLVFTDQGNLLRATLEKSGYREMNRAHVVEPLYSFGGRKVAWVPPAFAEHSAILRSDTEVIRIDLSGH